MSEEPEFPEVTLDLTNVDGNAFVLIGKCRKAMLKHGVPDYKIDEFLDEATSGDYDYLLRAIMTYVHVEFSDFTPEEDESWECAQKHTSTSGTIWVG